MAAARPTIPSKATRASAWALSRAASAPVSASKSPLALPLMVAGMGAVVVYLPAAGLYLSRADPFAGGRLRRSSSVWSCWPPWWRVTFGAALVT